MRNSHASSLIVVVGHVTVLPLVQGPAELVCTAAAWSPTLCRRPADKFHEAQSGWVGLHDVPTEQTLHSEVLFYSFSILHIRYSPVLVVKIKLI